MNTAMLRNIGFVDVFQILQDRGGAGDWKASLWMSKIRLYNPGNTTAAAGLATQWAGAPLPMVLT